MGRKKSDSTGAIIGVGIAAGIGLMAYSFMKKGAIVPAGNGKVPPPPVNGGNALIVPDAGPGGKDPVVKTNGIKVVPPTPPPAVDTNPWTKKVIDPITHSEMSVDKFIRTYTQEDVKAAIAAGECGGSPIFEMAMAAGLRPEQIVDRMAVGSPTTKYPTENLKIDNRPTESGTAQTAAKAKNTATPPPPTKTETVVYYVEAEGYGSIIEMAKAARPGWRSADFSKTQTKITQETFYVKSGAAATYANVVSGISSVDMYSGYYDKVIVATYWITDPTLSSKYGQQIWNKVGTKEISRVHLGTTPAKTPPPSTDPPVQMATKTGTHGTETLTQAQKAALR